MSVGGSRPRLLYPGRPISSPPPDPAITAPRPPRSTLPVRARLRDVAMWFVTAIDDILIERTWRALRRGDHPVTTRTWRDLVLGFPGCAVPILVVVAALVAWLVLGWGR